MNSQEIKELLDEVKASNETPVVKAQLLASYLQAYHLAIIGEELRGTRLGRTGPLYS